MQAVWHTLKVAGFLILLLSASRPTGAQSPPTRKPVLVLRAVPVPRKDFLYQVLGSRNFTSYAEVACVVRNASTASVTIHTCTADWYENWGIDGWPVKAVRFSYSANAQITIVLAPGETYAKMVPITFDDAKVGQMVRFRVRFVTDPDLGRVPPIPNRARRASMAYTVLSSPISMRVPEHTVHKIGATF